MIKLIGAAMLALAAGFVVESAKADEAFVCEGGRLVQVKRGQLDELKRRDECIAGYFGLKVTPVPSPRAAEAPVAAVLIEGEIVEGAKLLEPSGPLLDANGQPLVARIIAPVAVLPTRGGDVGFVIEPHMPSDYRNVRIINAQTGEPGYFRHRR